MCRFAPLIATLIPLVVSYWIPHPNSEYDLLNDTANTSPLAHNALSSNVAAPMAECEGDWVCGLGCTAEPPLKGPDGTNFHKFVQQDTVPSGPTSQSRRETTGRLYRPAPGGLGPWAEQAFAKKNYSLTLDVGDTYDSTSMFIPWAGDPFLAAVDGLNGCTAVILTCDCGVFLSDAQAHFWERPFMNLGDDAFLELVLNALRTEKAERDSWLGIPMLPHGCFTASTRLKAVIFSRTRSTIAQDGTSDPHTLSTVPSYPGRIQQIKDTLADLLKISADDIVTQLYTRKAGMRGGDPTTAIGKILVSYSPDVDNNQDNPRSGYEVWAGAVLENGVPTVKDSDVHEPIMSDFWTCGDLTDLSHC